ncbi:MAG TPA: hypothetical protein VGX68_11255 [Thermoanaerobaculia bacterium]|nr:hypothetical protein [Thermoanaerobaculia bacterium]
MATISFGSEVLVAQGGGPGAVAVSSNGTVVVVILSATSLQYTVGTCDSSAMTVSFPYGVYDAYTWSQGDAVSFFDVAMAPDTGQVVLVFQQGAADQLRYMVGTLAPGSISWGPATSFDSGQHPSVTVNGTTVVEMHNSQNNTSKLYYHQGQISGTTITGFDQSGTSYAGVGYPVRTISTSMNEFYWLLTTVTWVPADNSASGSVNYYGSGGNFYQEGLQSGSVTVASNSNVVLFPSGLALEVHNPNLSNAVYYTQGTYDQTYGDKNAGSVAWDQPVEPSIAGVEPDIAACGPYAVLTYASTDGTLSTMARFVSVS